MMDRERMSFLTDLELIAKLQEGKEEAFDCLLKRYEPFVKRIAKRYFVPGFDWEDFYQVGAMAFFNAVKTYKEDKNASFYTYALSCIRNRIVSQYRKLSMKIEYVIEDERLMFVMDAREACSATSSQMLDEEKDTPLSSYKQKLKKIVDKVKLSHLEKACLEQYLSGKTYEEAAEALGISKKQMGQALFRCRKKVRECGLMDVLYDA